MLVPGIKRNSSGNRASWFEFAVKEWLLGASAVGLLLTSLYLKRVPSYTLRDLEILYILFVLFIIIKGLERSDFFNSVAAIMERGGFLPFKLIAGTMLLSMFITNDVALLIVVPMTLKLNVSRKGILVILEALAANAGSALTPFGNPQNLFLYWSYGLHPLEFMAAIAPFTLVFLVILGSLSLLLRVNHHTRTKETGAVGKTSFLYFAFLLLFILAVLQILPLAIGLAVVVYVLIRDRGNLKVDYSLLATFFCFFGLTDNLKEILLSGLQNPGHVFLFSALASQFVGNVPAALLVADFTANWRALLWGVSVGGFGGLVSSLANLIAYRLYVTGEDVSASATKGFLLKFHLAGYGAFLTGIGLYYLLGALST